MQLGDQSTGIQSNRDTTQNRACGLVDKAQPALVFRYPMIRLKLSDGRMIASVLALLGL